MSDNDRQTDPYGILQYTVGDDDDFWCFDYAIDRLAQTVTLHAVINSETGCFIQDAEEPVTVPMGDAFSEACRLIDAAHEWCWDNDVATTTFGKFPDDIRDDIGEVQ